MAKGHHRGENPADRRVTAGEAVTPLIGLRHDRAGAINNNDRSRRSAHCEVRWRRKPTKPRQNLRLLDHLVGEDVELRRYGDPKPKLTGDLIEYEIDAPRREKA
jgi:hypothetical protein